MMTLDGSIPVAGDLLFTRRLRPQAGRTVPLMMEFQVNPETGPFLVSSSMSMFWVPAPKGELRAAFRAAPVMELYVEVVRQVAEVGAAHRWGNVHPLTPGGLMHAIGHLRSYDLTDLEILVPPSLDLTPFHPVKIDLDKESAVTIFGMPVTEATWLPANVILVVPQERDLVGTLVTYEGRALVVVHNASRGVAVCLGEP